ncbi:MAG: nicotinamide mononucleotide transporter [Clostridia bacterium]|nr:nicotinamide mononucleotide transporter [Clostridia bacterium]
MKKLKGYFSKFEITLWITSVVIITASFFAFDRTSYLTLIASDLGVTAILLNAKGNPVGQGLMVIFSIIYGIISMGFAYYGEMITYVGMSMPMAIIALISWLKNPFNGNHTEVKVNRISKKETLFMILLTAVVTALFFFILKAFNTANLIPSTFSVTTSFAAVYLTFRRSPYFSLLYAANDVVLIVLWILAAIKDISYLSVVMCFAMFLANDLYAFINWRKMEIRQRLVD